jgi:hypothetical protein
MLVPKMVRTAAAMAKTSKRRHARVVSFISALSNPLLVDKRQSLFDGGSVEGACNAVYPHLQ